MRLRLLLSVVAIAGVTSTGPAVARPDGGAPTIPLEALTISGPATIAPGRGATFTATGRMADGTMRDVTDRALWRSSNASVLSVSTGGVATGATSGDVQVVASLGALTTTMGVLVVPAGTFRLSGVVLYSGTPLAGATVAVIAGLGLGMSALTNTSGAYVLYGVGGDVEIQVTKTGYKPATTAIALTRSCVLDFPDLQRDGRPARKVSRN